MIDIIKLDTDDWFEIDYFADLEACRTYLIYLRFKFTPLIPAKCYVHSHHPLFSPAY
jgi:hypothetical protein